MLEDEFVVDEFEESSRVEGPATHVYEVLDVVSGWMLVLYRSIYRLQWLTYSSVSGLGVTIFLPFTSRTVIA